MTMMPITPAPAGIPNTNSKPAKLKGFRVTLYGDYSRPLFQRTGKAETAANAEQLSFEIYALVVQALCQAQGVTASIKALKLEIRASNVQSTSAPEGWRIRCNLPRPIEGQNAATFAGLPRDELRALVADAALADAICREAARERREMRVGFWFCRAAGKGLNDIGACLLVRRDGREVRHAFENAALRDALRLVSLRTTVPFSGGTPFPEFHPFAGPACDVAVPSSAVVRTIRLREPPQAPEILLNWLDKEGYGLVANRLRAS